MAIRKSCCKLWVLGVGWCGLTMSFGWHLVLERPYYIAAHEIVVGLGPQRTHSFAVFHALASCDAAPDDIRQEVMVTIKRFTILIYNQTSTCADINDARRKFSVKRYNVLSIPPTPVPLRGM